MRFDTELIKFLTRQSTLVVSGELADWSALPGQHVLPRTAQMPCRVKIFRVLRGERAIRGEVITVGSTRDDLAIRYEPGAVFVFFLKAHANGWQLASDQFGVEFLTPALEGTILSED